jgi:hypothetical protein
MKKLPIGPIIVGMVIIGLVGVFLLMPAKQPPPTDNIAVVIAPPTAAIVAPPVANAVAPTAHPTAELAPGEDPPARREPGAINYADKGVLPAL